MLVHEVLADYFIKFKLSASFSMNQKRSFLMVALLAVLFQISGVVAEEGVLEKNFSLLEQWVETEKTLTKEKFDWEVQKQGLIDLISVYEQELEMLDEQIAEAEEFTSASDEKKSGLLEEQDVFRAIEADLKAIVEEQENRLKGIIARLPAPLQQEIAPLSQRIPEDSEATSLSISQRLQSIVGILTQLDKFNTAVEVVPEQREFESGSLVQVKTIYFGLGAAYYADNNGSHAGYGRPSETEGWVWTEDPEIAPEVLKLIAMYEGATTEIEFLPVPVKLN
jgi:hypothetical protein